MGQAIVNSGIAAAHESAWAGTAPTRTWQLESARVVLMDTYRSHRMQCSDCIAALTVKLRDDADAALKRVSR